MKTPEITITVVQDERLIIEEWARRGSVPIQERFSSRPKGSEPGAQLGRLFWDAMRSKAGVPPVELLQLGKDDPCFVGRYQLNEGAQLFVGYGGAPDVFEPQYLGVVCYSTEGSHQTIFASTEVMHRLQDRIAVSDAILNVRRLLTGLESFDGLTGGFDESEFCVLASRPSMGKTTLAKTLAVNIAMKAKEPRGVFFLSFETDTSELIRQMVCSAAGVEWLRFLRRETDAAEKAAIHETLQKYLNAPLVFGKGISDPTALRTVLKAQMEEMDLGLVIVDSLQRMDSSGRFVNRTQNVAALCRELKLLAKELHVPFLGLYGVPRKPETNLDCPKSSLIDFEDDAVEQYADRILFLCREEMPHSNAECQPGIAQLEVLKQGFGPTGTSMVGFSGSHQHFYDLSGPSERKACLTCGRDHLGSGPMLVRDR